MTGKLFWRGSVAMSDVPLNGRCRHGLFAAWAQNKSI